MAKPYYEFFCPVKIVAGHMALEHIPFELSTLQAKRPMIITDKGVRGAGLLAHVEAAFEGAEAVIAAIYDDVPPDSSLTTVRDAAALFRANNCDAIIAIGGGSVIDTSKGVNILVTEGGDDLMKRDKANLDIFWLKDKALADGDDLPEPDVLAAEIAEDLQDALEQFNTIAKGLKG